MCVTFHTWDHASANANTYFDTHIWIQLAIVSICNENVLVVWQQRRRQQKNGKLKVTTNIQGEIVQVQITPIQTEIIALLFNL